MLAEASRQQECLRTRKRYVVIEEYCTREAKESPYILIKKQQNNNGII